MAKDFSKGKKTFEAAKAAESIMAKVDEIKNLDVNVIEAYADNNEDVSNVEDLETSMKENGFTDPIEVTNYGCEDGRYVILSGHRRYTAWTRLHNGKQPIKCIIVDAAKFKSPADVKNYVLMANSQRDSAKDPLLLVKRYKEHERYLNGINFDGNVRDEIAKRLGVSTQQADRYKQLGKCIPEIQNMVAEEKLGLSSAVYVAPLDSAEQKKFYQIMLDAIDDNTSITRTLITKMIKYFKMELWTWEAIKTQIKQENSNLDIVAPGTGNSNSNSSVEKGPADRNSEVRREFDPIAANADEDDRAQAEYDAENDTDNAEPENDTENLASTKNDDDFSDSGNDEEGISKERKNANNLIRLLKKLGTSLPNDMYEFEDEDAVVAMAKETIESIKAYLIDPFLK